jgi:hypothetical protein
MLKGYQGKVSLREKTIESLTDEWMFKQKSGDKSSNVPRGSKHTSIS